MNHMSQRPDDAGAYDPLGYWKTMRDQGMDTWSKMMIDFVNTDTFARSVGSWLDNYLAVSAPFRKSMQSAMTEILGTYNMPTRAEVTSIAERLTNIEMRLDDLDAKIDSLHPGVSQESPTGAGATGRQEDK
jgi:hypothetical protein